MDKQRTGANVHPERDFSNLNDKSPVELIAEMEDIISNMSEEDFDNQQVESYLTALNKKTPGIDEFEPEVSFAKFLSKYAASFEQLSAIKSKTPSPKRLFRHRFVYVAATILMVLFVGTFTANAYGINIFEVIVQWGENVFQMSRGKIDLPSGNLELPDDNNAEYRSMEDALAKYGLPTNVCPTWIPERYRLSVIEVQEDSGEIGFCALYQDQEGNSLLVSIDYAPDSQAVYYIEKDPDSGQVYYDHGVEYYLVTNEGDWAASWLDNNSFYLISGAISEDELKHMLSSIYERQAS